MNYRTVLVIISTAIVLALSTAADPASVPPTTTAAPVGQQGPYARRSAFGTGAHQLGFHDAAIEKCQGTRGSYRTQFDSLVSVAHSDYRTEAMSVYDNQYSRWKQMENATPEGSSMLGSCSKLEDFKAAANGMLDRLGANCAAASQCDEMSVQTSVPEAR